MKSYSSREIIKIIEADGWYLVRQNGTSHQQYHHSIKSGTVTVKHPEKDMNIKTLKSIERQSGIKFK